jgi:ssDNA-specific exonuclease RecJ
MEYNLTSAANKLGIGEKFLKDHFNVFYRELSENLEKIRSNVKSEDFDKIYFEFHRLKSTFRMISASEAEDLCRKCCDFSKDEEVFDYESALDKIISITDDLKLIINETE